MKSKLKNFSLLTISTLIMAVGIYFFKFANNFTFGGITGIAVLVAKFLPISASDFSFVVNILLLIIGWIVLGKSFAEKTAYSTILLSVSLSLLERIYPMSHPLTNEPLLELIFAILLPALGSAILFQTVTGSHCLVDRSSDIVSCKSGTPVVSQFRVSTNLYIISVHTSA